ncbi:MAG TPA: hypothetical protein VN445_09695 [Rectinemataceae bacterium]|nr:hypothetical protein [Rectinemataceae bacterium]
MADDSTVVKSLRATKRYAVFGLTVESEIELPGLIASQDMPEGHIVFGKVPEHLDMIVEKTPWFEVAPRRLLLRIDKIARYYVEDGKYIVIEPCQNAQAEDIAVFLLDTVFAALLQQRGFFALHGSAVVVEGKAVILLGASSVGKTTIALALHDRGCPLLADEVCAIGMRDGNAVVFPGVPQLNIWEDTLLAAGKDVSGYRPIRQGLGKYVFRVEDRFCEEAVGLTNIVLLKGHNREAFEVETIRGGAKFESLLKNAFFAETAADRSRLFGLCAAASASRVVQVTFNNRTHDLDSAADFILKELA